MAAPTSRTHPVQHRRGDYQSSEKPSPQGEGYKEMIKIEITYRAFSLEIWENEPQLSLSVYSGETGRGFEIELMDKGENYLIPENCRAVFTALKPDGKLIFNPCQIQDNKIFYTLTPQSTALAGLLSCQLRLYGENDALILSPRFSLLVRPSVYSDEGILESENEVAALTALVSEAQELISEVSHSLQSGAFVPDFSVGLVETLPAGHMAQVELSGTGDKPVLSFKIPQGEMGTNEGLIPDAALSATSTRPVQNSVLFDALSKKVEKTEFELSIANFVEKNYFSETLSNFVEMEEFRNSMAGKQDREEGKALSSNDFTDELKAKLDGIEAGANKFVLTDSSVSTAKIADYAVTANKLAAGAKSRAEAVTLSVSGWADNTQTVSLSAVTASNNLIVAAAPESRSDYNDAEIYCASQAEGSLTFKCASRPAADVTANVIILV